MEAREDLVWSHIRIKMHQLYFLSPRFCSYKKGLLLLNQQKKQQMVVESYYVLVAHSAHKSFQHTYIHVCVCARALDATSK